MAKYTTMHVAVGTLTDKAAELTFHEDTKEENTLWVPLSLIEDPDALDVLDDNGCAEISVAKWFLQKNDIEYGPDIMEEVREVDDFQGGHNHD